MSVEPLSFSDDGGSDLGERGIRIAATPNAVSCSDSDLEHRGCTLPGDVGSSSDSDLGPPGCVGLLGARGDDIATRPASNPDVAVDGAPEVAANLDAHAVAIVPANTPHVDWVALQTTKSCRNSETEEMVDSVIDNVLGEYPRLCGSFRAEAAMLKVPERGLREHLQEAAAVSLEAALAQVDALLQKIDHEVSEGHILHNVATCTLNDETSLKVALNQEDQSEWAEGWREAQRTRVARQRASDQKNKVVVKVMQSDCSVGFLLESPTEGLYVTTIEVPTTLQFIDHNTSEVVVECVRLCYDIPALDRLIDACHAVDHLTTNDRASSNNRCEAHLRSVMKDGHNRLRLTCDIHKAYQPQTGQYDLCKPTISGCLNTALAMNQAGATELLRKCLKAWFGKRLRVYKGVPPPDGPAAVHRQGVYDLFCPADTVQGQQRKVILTRMINGRLWRRSCVEHWCPEGCCTDRTTQEIFDEDVVSALVPHACPKFPRARWVGADKSHDYLGLLTNSHHLLPQIVSVWARAVSKHDVEISDEVFDDMPELDSGSEGGDSDDKKARQVNFEILTRGAVVDDKTKDARPGEDDRPVICDAPDNVVPAIGPSGEMDWSEFNRRARTGAVQFATADPGSVLTINRVSMEPNIKNLMAPLLKLAKADFDVEQASSQDGRVKLRVLELAQGKPFEKYDEALEERILSSGCWEALPAKEKHTLHATYAFKLNSRAGGTTSCLLTDIVKGYPLRMFLLLLGDPEVEAQVKKDPSCLYDEWAAEHVRQYPGDMLWSKESLMRLYLQALMAVNQIVKIEARHATLRRALLRALQTHSRNAADLGRDFFLLRQRLAERGVFAGRDKRSRAAATRTNKRRSSKKSRRTTKQLSQTKRNKRRRASRVSRQSFDGLWEGRVCHRVTPWNVYVRSQSDGIVGIWQQTQGMGVRDRYREIKRAGGEPFERLVATAKRETQILRSAAFAKRNPSHPHQVRPSPSTSTALVVQEDRPSMLKRTAEAMESSTEALQVVCKKLRAAGTADARAEAAAERAILVALQAKTTPRPGQFEVCDARLAATPLNFAVVKSSAPVPVAKIIARPSTRDISQKALKRLPVGVRKALSTKFSRRFNLIKHRSCEQLGKVKYPTLKICHVAGRCLCSAEGKLLVKFCNKLNDSIRTAFPPPAKKGPRFALKAADVVVKVCDEHGGVAVWNHISYINLNSFVMRLLNLIPADNYYMDLVAPRVALKVLGCKWLNAWDSFRHLDLAAKWYAEYYLISGDCSTMVDPFIPGICIPVRWFGERHCLWNPDAPVRPALTDAPLDTAPTPAAPADPDDDEMDSEREDEEAVNALVDGMLDEELAFEASDDGSWSEPHDSDDDPPPPGGPHGPRPPIQPLPVEEEPPIIVGAAGGVAAVAAGAVENAEEEPPAAPRRVAAGPAGHRYINVPIPSRDDPLVIVGDIKHNRKSETLDAMCRRCNYTIDRFYRPRKGIHGGDKHHQGRPMGTLLQWLQLDCGGSREYHKHYKALPEMAHNRRVAARLWGHTLVDARVAEMFALERPKWTHEADEEPLAPA